MRSAARVAVALALVALGVGFLVVAYGPLHNLWADYQDSPDSTYLLLGVPLVASSLACFGAAFVVLRWR